MEALEYLLLFILAPCSQILLIVLLVLGVRWRGRSPLWLPIVAMASPVTLAVYVAA